MNKIFYYSSFILAFAFLSLNTLAKEDVDKIIDKHQSKFEKTALDIWDFAELGYQEYKSSNLLKEQLESEGFSIKVSTSCCHNLSVVLFVSKLLCLSYKCNGSFK